MEWFGIQSFTVSLGLRNSHLGHVSASSTPAICSLLSEVTSLETALGLLATSNSLSVSQQFPKRKAVRISSVHHKVRSCEHRISIGLRRPHRSPRLSISLYGLWFVVKTFLGTLIYFGLSTRSLRASGSI
jgi:hypothetical protein